MIHHHHIEPAHIQPWVNPCTTANPLAPLSPADETLALEANHDLTKLDPDFRTKLTHVIEEMIAAGYEPVLLEGYRSPQRQQDLLDHSPGVTKAGACMSWHQYGLAADIGFKRNGVVQLEARSPWGKKAYSVFSELAGIEGLAWGGKWGDEGHVELHKGVRFHHGIEVLNGGELAALPKPINPMAIWVVNAPLVCEASGVWLSPIDASMRGGA